MTDVATTELETTDAVFEGGLPEASFWRETTGLVSVGLTVWIAASVAAFAGLSGSGIAGDLRSDELRAATLLVGFAVGALALLGWGTVGLLTGGRQVVAVVAAVAAFLLPPAVAVVWQTLENGRPMTLAPGLLALLLAHAVVLWFCSPRERRRLDRIWVPEAALLILGLAMAVGDLAPATMAVGVLR